MSAVHWALGVGILIGFVIMIGAAGLSSVQSESQQQLFLIGSVFCFGFGVIDLFVFLLVRA